MNFSASSLWRAVLGMARLSTNMWKPSAGSTHWKNFSRLRSQIQEAKAKKGDSLDVLALAAGSCTHCKTCAYPDDPCRFPEAAASSVEAYGLLVNQLCVDNGLAYNYGENTIAYTALFLFK